MESTIVQKKIKFLLCETELGKGKFVLQAENPQYLFQVLYFENHAQFEQFQLINKTEPYVKVLGYRIALRLSAALQPVNVTQQNADSIYSEAVTVMQQACTWFIETCLSKSESTKAMYKDNEV